MDTGKPALGKRFLSSFFALTLVMGLVPVSAYAEVGKAQEQQGQEQSEQSAAASGESASEDAPSGDAEQGGVSSDSKGGASAGSASGAEAGSAETPKASGSASGNDNAAASNTAASNDAAAQSADNGIAVQAAVDYTVPYNGDDTFKKSDIYRLVRNNFGSYARYKIKSGNVENEITTWVLSADRFEISDSGKYDVSGTSGLRWSALGTLIFQKTWNAAFSFNIPEGGVEVIGSTLSDNVVTANDGDTVKFKVKDVDGKKVTVKRASKDGSDSVEMKADGDGVYSFTSDKNSTIKVDYDTVSASLTANFDKGSVGSFFIGEDELFSGVPVEIAAGYENRATIKPEGNYAITSVVLNGGEYSNKELVSGSSFSSKDTRAAEVTIPKLEAGVSYTLTVSTGESKLVLKNKPTAAVKTVDSSEFADRVIAGAIDLGSSVPSSMSKDDLDIEYKAGFAWYKIDRTSITGHKFGQNATETIRITYKGNEQYSGLDAVETPIDIVATPTEMNVDPSGVTVPFGTTESDLKAEILKSITVKDAISGKVLDVADGDISLEGYDSQKAGEQAVTVKFNGSDSYNPCQADATVVVAEAPTATLNAEFDNATVTALGNPLNAGDNKILAGKEDGSLVVAPVGVYAVTSVKLDGEELLAPDSFKDHVATVSLPAFDKGSTHNLVVETKECKLTVKDSPSAAVRNVDSSLFEQRVIDGVLDLENSVPSNISASELEITYLAGTGLFTGEDWEALDFEPSTLQKLTHHKFGTQENEKIRIKYKGNSQYCELSTGDSLEISTPDGRPTVQMATVRDSAWVYNDTDENVDAAIKQAVIDSKEGFGLTITDEAGSPIEYSADNITVTGYKHELGTYTVSVTYTDPAEKYQPTTIEGLQLEIKKVPSAQFTATFNNAMVKAYDFDLTSGQATDIPSGKPGDVVVTPDEGYAVTKVEFNGEDISSKMAFDGGTHAATINMDALETDKSYTLTVETKKVAIATKAGASVAVLGLTTPAKIKQRVIEGVVDFDNSVPSSMSADDLTIEYKAGSTNASWKPLDYTPSAAEKFIGYKKFGERTNETIRITYKGNAQYCEVKSDEISVAIVDGRTPTHLAVADSITVKYAPEDDLKAAIRASLNPQVFNDETGEAIEFKDDEIEVDYTDFKREVGTQHVTVKYKGNEEFKNCELKDVAIKITKGNAKVTVNSQNISYGQTPDTLVSATPEEAKPIYIIGGIDGNGNAYVSIDFKSVTVNDLAGKDIPLVGDWSLQDVVISVLGGNEFSANKLLGSLDKVEKLLSMLGVQDAADVVAGIREAIEAIGKVAPGVMDSTIVLGGTPTEAGVYTIAAISVNPNYKTSVALGYLTIAPATEDVELTWNEELPSKNLSLDDAAGFDFGVKAWQGETDVTGKANVKVRFIGTDYDGNAYNSTEAPTKPGYYSQMASIIGGNYFAKPIARNFNILREDSQLALSFDGQTGSKQETAYDGEQPKLEVTVSDAAGNPIKVDQSALSVGFAGLTANGKIYASSKVPTEAGEYLVSATFLGDATHGVSSFNGRLTIKASEVEVFLPEVHTIYGDEIEHDTEAFSQIGGGYIAQADKDAIRSGVTCECADGATVSGSPYLVTANIPDSVKNNRNYKVTVSGKAEDGVHGLHYIEKRHASVTIANASKVYGGEDPAFEFTVYDKYDGTKDEKFDDQAAIAQELGIAVTRPDKGTEIGEAKGEHKLVGSWNNNANYTLSFNDDATLTIAERSMRVEIQSASKYYGDDDPEFTYKVFDTSVPGTETEITDQTEIAKLGISVTRAEGNDAGTYALKGDWTNKNYAVSFNTDAKLTINARPMKVAINPASKIYGNADDPFTYTVYDATTDPATECRDQEGIAKTLGIAITRAQGEDAGEYALSGTWNNDNYKVDFTDAKFTINPRPTRVDIANVTKVYGEKDPAVTGFTYKVFDTAVNPEAEYTDSKTIESMGITISCGKHSEDVGEYNLVGTCSNGNYEVTFTGKLTITPATVTVKLPSIESVYGDEVSKESHASQATVTGPITDEDKAAVLGTVTCGCDCSAAADVDTYTISATVPATVEANQNYKVNVEPGRHVVKPRPTHVAIDNVSKKYGDKDPAATSLTYKVFDAAVNPEAEYTDSTKIESMGIAVSCGEHSEDVGTYSLVGTSANKNYDVTFTGTLAITPAEVTVALPTIESTYGEAVAKEAHADRATVTGPITDEDKAAVLGTVSCDCGYAETANAGTHKITAKVPGTVATNKNYNIKIVDGVHTVKPAEVTVTMPNIQSVYGDAVSMTSHLENVTFNGPISSEDKAAMLRAVSCGCACSAQANVGDHTVTAEVPESVKANKNYNVTVESGTHTIIARKMIVEVLSAEKTFGDPDPKISEYGFKAWDNSGSVVRDVTNEVSLEDLGVTVTRENTTEDAGVYDLSCSSANPNYSIEFKGHPTLTIKQQKMLIELQSATKISGEEEPDYSFLAWYVLPGENDAQAVSTYALDEAGSLQDKVPALKPCTDPDVLASLGIKVTREDSSETPGVYALKGESSNPNYQVGFSQTVATLTVHPRVDATVDSEGGKVTSSVKGGPEGTVITVEATPDEGYVFDEWVLAEGDGVIADPKAAKTTITVGKQNVVVKAKFSKKPVDPVTPVDPGADDPGTDPGQGGGSADNGNASNVSTVSAKANEDNASTATKTGDSLGFAAALVAVLGVAAAAAAFVALRKTRRRKH